MLIIYLVINYYKLFKFADPPLWTAHWNSAVGAKQTFALSYGGERRRQQEKDQTALALYGLPSSMNLN